MEEVASASVSVSVSMSASAGCPVGEPCRRALCQGSCQTGMFAGPDFIWRFSVLALALTLALTLPLLTIDN
jgi:hypothetical protein